MQRGRQQPTSSPWIRTQPRPSGSITPHWRRAVTGRAGHRPAPPAAESARIQGRPPLHGPAPPLGVDVVPGTQTREKEVQR